MIDDAQLMAFADGMLEEEERRRVAAADRRRSCACGEGGAHASRYGGVARRFRRAT